MPRNRKPRTKIHARPRPTQVVYLIGAGGTQAEINYLGAAKINLLMQDNVWGDGVSTGVLNRLGARGRRFLADKGVDIEKLISLLTGSGLHDHLELAEKLRESYFAEICKRLDDAHVIDNPALATALLVMHKNSYFRQNVESLTGVITTNHDGLLQKAAQSAYGALNVGFKFGSGDFRAKNRVPNILQIHGSLTWAFGTPLRITALRKGSKYSTDTSWIPPTVTKEAKSYPFNKLMGLSYEMLSKKCDVLRIIGSSLTQNDWNILGLIFNAQRHRQYLGNSEFRIELIMPQRIGKNVEADCSFLGNLFPIGSLTDGDFAEYKEYEKKDPDPDTDWSNPFFYWLKEKITYHIRSADFGGGKLPDILLRVSGGAP